MIDGGIRIPLLPKKGLLNIADMYCNIEICPNLKCKFVIPTIKLLSFKIFMNGKWYNPASGLFVFSREIKITVKIDKIKILMKSFL